MARPLRIDERGMIHHVFQRGNRKGTVFHSDEDRRLFLRRLASLKAETGFKLFAYCLMSNHYHLLVETGRIPLALVMHRLLTSFARNLNDNLGSPGHVFQGRYNAKPCRSDPYYLTALAYIHLNPVEAEIVREPAEWRWSGHVGLTRGGDPLIDRTEALELLPGGLGDYAEAIDRGRVSLARPRQRPSLTQLCEQARSRFRVGVGALEGPSNIHALTIPRSYFINRALANGFTNKELAAFLNRSRSAICRLSEKTQRED